jgi:acetoacetyl-[acyl-carrier protein] synthase
VGACIYGSVPTVASHADGGKRSISAPGAGNYLTVAQAAATIRDLLGQTALETETLVQAHGTSTPQNRVTESDVLSQVATAFGIRNWPVAAVKSLLGHAQGTAGGDQLAASLSAFAHHTIPGIQTTDAVAPDVRTEGLEFVLETREQPLAAALINAKGFGGNNATAAVLSPDATARVLASRHGEIQLAGSDDVQTAQARYRDQIDRGMVEILYHYGEDIVEGTDLTIEDDRITVPGFGVPLSLDTVATLYSDLVQSQLQSKD